MARTKPPSRRADVLAAARAAFNARGFAGARMDDIARAVGISKAALYLDFPSKQALFEALITELIETMLPEAVPEHFGDIPGEVLLRGFIAVMTRRIMQDDMALVPRVIIGEGLNFPELARFYHDHVIARGIGAIERIVAHAVARGEFVCEDVPQAARSVVGGVLLGAIWKMVFEPVGAVPLDPGALARGHADTLLNGLKLRKDAA
jgi:AcrR family transcriptional regulator